VYCISNHNASISTDSGHSDLGNSIDMDDTSTTRIQQHRLDDDGINEWLVSRRLDGSLHDYIGTTDFDAHGDRDSRVDR